MRFTDYRLFAVARRLLVAAGLASALLMTGGTPASALCIDPPERGTWVNVNPATRSITRAIVQFTCVDVITPGRPIPPSWHVTLWGKCHPTDCPWGRVPGRSGPGGVVNATYNQGFATRAVTINALPSGQLHIRIATNFRDPGRPDYVSNDIMRLVRR